MGRGTTSPRRADDRAIALLVACRLVATLANTSCFTVGVLGTAVYDLGATVFEVSLLMLVVNLAIVAGNAVGGLAVDALGPRRVLVAGLVGYTLTAVVFFAVPLSLTALTAVCGLYSAVFGAIVTVFTSLPPFVVSDAFLARANSLMATAENAAYIVGPALGGMVALACLVPMAFLAFFAFGAFDSLETVYYRDVLQVGVEWTGWLNAVMGLGATAGSLALLRVPEQRQTVGLAAGLVAVVGAGTVLYVATTSPLVAACGMAVLGFGWGLFEPLLNLVVQRDAPEGAVGRVMGVLQMGQRSSGVLPLLAAPFLAQAFGVQPVLVTAGVVALVAGLAFVAVARRVAPGR